MICARPRNKQKDVKGFSANMRLPMSAAFTPFLFLVALVTLILIAGCPPAEPRFEPVHAGPNLPEMVAEPCAVEPDAVGNTATPLPQPETVEPDSVEPNSTGVNPAESNEPGPSQMPPVAPEPNKKPAPRVLFHDKCREILKTFVNSEGMVDYRKLKRKRSDLEALLDEFAGLDRNEYIRWPKEEKIALWINAYNIQMLKVIILNYPIDSSRFWRLFGWPPTSIRHIEPKDVFGSAKWDRYKLLVMDEEFTLSEIEERFFRKEFDDPRVFLALTQGCLSGPPLRNEPYYGYKLDEQLNDQARGFFTRPVSFQIHRDKQEVLLSSLFDPTWYGKDFIPKYGTDKKFKNEKPAVRATLNFITNYVSSQDVAFLETQYYEVSYITFDWRLNDSEEGY